jgi:hypothetical protein
LTVFAFLTRKFSDAKEKREEQKKADVRLKNFLKVSVKNGAEGGTGSFGGRPKPFKGVRSNRTTTKPAWLGIASDADPDDEIV